MATNYPLSDVFYIYGLGSWSTSGGSTSTVEFSEEVRISDSTTVESVTFTDITSDETIRISESLAVEVQTQSNCFPWGGYRKFPALVLQRRFRTCQFVDIGDGVFWQWAWGDWTNYLTLELNEKNFDASSGIGIKPGFKVLPTHEPVRNGYGGLVKFPERRIPYLDLKFLTLFCEQEPWKFFEDYAIPWHQSCSRLPNSPSGSCATTDTVVSEQRRIMLYVLGLEQENRFGDPVDPIEVRIMNYDYDYLDHKYGVWIHHCELEAVHALKHEIFSNIVSADYDHSDTEATERDRQYQGIVAWGDGGEYGDGT